MFVVETTKIRIISLFSTPLISHISTSYCCLIAPSLGPRESALCQPCTRFESPSIGHRLGWGHWFHKGGDILIRESSPFWQDSRNLWMWPEIAMPVENVILICLLKPWIWWAPNKKSLPPDLQSCFTKCPWNDAWDELSITSRCSNGGWDLETKYRLRLSNWRWFFPNNIPKANRSLRTMKSNPFCYGIQIYYFWLQHLQDTKCSKSRCQRRGRLEQCKFSQDWQLPLASSSSSNLHQWNSDKRSSKDELGIELSHLVGMWCKNLELGTTSLGRHQKFPKNLLFGQGTPFFSKNLKHPFLVGERIPNS